MIDYPSIPVASLVIVAVLVLSWTNRHTHTQTDVDDRFTLMTFVGMSSHLLKVKVDRFV